MPAVFSSLLHVDFMDFSEMLIRVAEVSGVHPFFVFRDNKDIAADGPFGRIPIAIHKALMAEKVVSGGIIYIHAFPFVRMELGTVIGQAAGRSVGIHTDDQGTSAIFCGNRSDLLFYLLGEVIPTEKKNTSAKGHPGNAEGEIVEKHAVS